MFGNLEIGDKVSRKSLAKCISPKGKLLGIGASVNIIYLKLFYTDSLLFSVTK